MDRIQRSWILRIAASIATLSLLGATCGAHGTAEAQHREGHREHWDGHPAEFWRHGDIRQFHEFDLDRWRGGHWIHGDHLGRLGWWWIVDGTWYFYPGPVYPYPDPYVPPTVAAQAPSQSSSQYWYYCASVKTYYPYVTACPEGWMPVVPQATPPGPAPIAP
jgi:hypothetical protein